MTVWYVDPYNGVGNRASTYINYSVLGNGTNKRAANTSLSGVSSNNWTLVLWFRPNTITADSYICHIVDAGGVYVQLYVRNSDKRLIFDLNGATTVSANTYNDTNWHSAVITSTNSSGNSAIVATIDGSDSASGTINSLTPSSIYLLGRSAGTNCWKGYMDDAILWNRVLTAGEISELVTPTYGLYVIPTNSFSSSGTLFSNSLVGLWRFDDGTGTTSSVDSSGNNNTLTLANWAAGDWISGVRKVSAGTSWNTAICSINFITGVGTPVANGDEFRVAKTDDIYQVDGGTVYWTSVTDSMSDYVATAITSSTNATPIEITKANHGLVTNDLVFITGHTTNTNANGYWRVTKVNNDKFTLVDSVGNGVGGATGTFICCNYLGVRFSTTRWKNISNCQNVGGAGTNCTVTKSTSNRPIHNMRIQTNASVTGAQKLGYITLPAALNLSGYQQLGFSIWSTAIMAASEVQVVLCSDTVGNTAVDTFNVPAVPAANQYNDIVLDKGSALGASIQSVAIYSTGSFASKDIYFGSFNAFLAPNDSNCITSKHLIGRTSSPSSHHWYNIHGFVDNYVFLGGYSGLSGQQYRGYFNTSETATTAYVRKMTTYAAIDNTYFMGYPNWTGNVTDYVTISGGWNTSNNTQDGETVLANQSYGRTGIYCAKNFVKFEKFWMNNVASGINIDVNATNVYLKDIKLLGCNTGWVSAGGILGTGENITMNGNNTGISWSGATNAFNLTNCWITGCNGGIGFNISTYTFQIVVTDDIVCANNFNNVQWYYVYNTKLLGKLIATYSGGHSVNIGYGSAIYVKDLDCSYQNWNYNSAIVNKGTLSSGLYGFYPIMQNDSVFDNIDCTSNGGRAFYLNNCDNLYINGGTASGSYYQSAIIPYGTGNIYFKNYTFSDSTEFLFNNNYTNSYVFSHDHDNTEGTHKIFGENCLITTDASTVHSSSPKSWKMSPLSSTYKTSNNPVTLKICRVNLKDSVQRTISVWVRRDDTNLTVKLVVRGKQLNGISSDVTDTASGSANTWERLSVDVTATEDGVLEAEVQCYGGSTYNCWVDDIMDMPITNAFRAQPYFFPLSGGSWVWC